MRQIAIIDIGSHSIKMDIFQYKLGDIGSVEIFESINREINLGADVFKRGIIGSSNMKLMCEIMIDLSTILKGYGISDYIATGTSALREATNKDIVIDRIRMTSGIAVSLLESQDEGKFLYNATKQLFELNSIDLKAQNLILFIGTGSLIVTFVKDGVLQFSESSSLGSIRVVDEYESKIKPQSIGELLKSMEYKKRLARFGNYNPELPCQIIGVGAGLRASDLIEEFDIYKTVLAPQINSMTMENVGKLSRIFRNKKPLDLVIEYDIAGHLGVSMINSFAIVNYFAQDFGSKKVLFPKVNTRSAMMLKVVDPKFKNIFYNDLISAVLNIGKKYDLDLEHAVLCKDIAVKIFDTIKSDYNMKNRHRLLLECASLLHDVGRFVDVKQHHKHSYYLINHSHIPGLSDNEIHQVATICRYHRKSPPKVGHYEYDKCSDCEKLIVLKLSAILRIADSLSIGGNKKHADLAISFEDDTLIIKSSSSKEMVWESLYLAKKGDLFKDVYGINLKFIEESELL